MDPDIVQKKVIDTLCQIQADSNLECPPLTGINKPTEDLANFDSIVWPVATTILATEIGVAIPDDTNIFINEITKLPRSIDEIAALLCDLPKNQLESEAA